MRRKRGFATKIFSVFLALLLLVSGVLPNLVVGLNKVFAATSPDNYFFINDSTTWSDNKTISQPVIIAPNATLTISTGAQITFDDDVIIYGKLINNGTLTYSKTLYANMYGSMMTGDTNYPDYGVVSNYGKITGGNLYVSADYYPEPPFSYTYTSETGKATATIQGVTVPGFVVNIGGSEVNAGLDGTFSMTVGVVAGSNNFNVNVRNVFGREFNLDPINIQIDGSAEPTTDITSPTWPADSKLSSANLTDTAAKLSWGQANDETGISGYYIYQNGSQIDTVSADVLSYEVKGLTPETSYQFKIEAYDSSWNVSTSGPSVDVTTKSSPMDSQSPTWQADAKVEASNIGDSSLVLNWSAATDDANVSNYKVYKNGSLLATVGGSVLSYTVTGLSPSTAYSFKIEAGDPSGNWTTNGPSVEVTTAASVPTAKVTFVDSRVEEEVRNSLGKPVGDITKEDMLDLTSLYLYRVSSLAGLQYAKNLQGLSIDRYLYTSDKPVDYSIISNLTNLTSLMLDNSGVDNLSFVSNLTKLTNLEVASNNISDLSPLSSLVNLTQLNLSYNQIKNLTGLESLTNLTNLYLSENQIEDLTPLIKNMENGGIGAGDYVNLYNNFLEMTQDSKSWTDIQTLKEKGTNVYYYQQYGKITIKATDLYNPDKVLSGIYPYLSGTNQSYSAEVDENGNYTFSRVTPGNYTLYLSPGEAYEYVQRDIKVLSGQRINLNIGLAPTTIDPSVTNGVITGIVKDENGVPVQGAKVYTQGGNDSTYTDYSGSYILRVPAGSYSVIAEANGYESGLEENIQVTSSQKSTKDFKLTSTADNPKVTFADSRVEEEVRNSLGKPVGDITKEDMLDLTSLYLYRVSSLAGLQYAKNLQGLSIDRYLYTSDKPVDYSIISNLTNLTSLMLDNSGVDNLSFVSNLTKLTNLEVASNNISDLSPLSSLVNLTQLNLSYNQIKNLTGLESLTSLTNLYLSENQIEDLTPLIKNMENGGIGAGDYVNLYNNFLEMTQDSKSWTDIQTLKEKGTNVYYYQQYGKITIKATDLYNPDIVLSGIYPYLSGTNQSYSAEVDENGNYTFSRVTPGNYTLYLSPGEAYEYVQRDIKVLSGQRINLNIGLAPTTIDPSVTNGVITGIVKDENGVPVQGAKVYTQGGNDSTYTDYSGSYILRVPAGSYSVIAEANGYESGLEENIQVTSSQKSTKDFKLTSTADNPKVTFADSRVEEEVRNSLGKPVGDITKEDMLDLTSLYLYRVSSLAGLQYAKNLQGLSIDRYLYTSDKPVDYSIISNLTNLTSLMLDNSGVDNLSFVSNLTKLTNLEVASNNISDLSPLSSLVNLTQLNLSYNQIKNLTGLESLTSLTNLYLSENQIEDLTPLIKNMENGGIGAGDYVNLYNNFLEMTQDSKSWTDIQTLKEKGTNVYYYQQYGKITIKATDLYNPDKVLSGIYPYLSGTNQSYSAEVDENGNYTFSRVTPGNYTLYLSPGEAYEYVQRDIKVLSGQRINLNIGLAPTTIDPSVTNGVITGIVKDENGVPVQGVKVYANNGSKPVYTDFSGYYVLPLDEGTYTIMYEAPSYLTIKKENVKVTKGQNTKLDILLASSTDSTAPEWAADSKLSISDVGENQVTLTWPSASDNNKIENYKVFVNDSLQKIVPGTVTTTEMTGLTTGTNYTFKVEAGDASGNWTENGPEATIRTHARADLAINFASEKVYVTESSTLTLKASHANNLYGFDVQLQYDPSLVEITDIKLNSNFGVNGTTASLLQSKQDGVIKLVGTRLGDSPGMSGEADLVDITFKALDKEGTAGFTILKGSSVSDTEDALYVSNENVNANLAIAIPVEGVNLDQTALTLDTSTQKEGALVAKVFPDDATNKEVTWSSSDPKIVEVDQNGKLTAISAGTATVIATTTDKQFKAEAVVTVISSVTGIELDQNLLLLDGATKESAVLSAKVLPENATNKKVIWTSSNPSVATVDQTGKVQAVALGNTVITATTDEGGYTATTDVKVTGIANFKVETSKDIIEKGENVSVSLKVENANKLNQFLLNYNYLQDLFEVVNISLDPAFGTKGDTADVSYTDDHGQVVIKGHLNDSQGYREGALGLVTITLKAKAKTQSSSVKIMSKSEYIDSNNITYFTQSDVEKKIAITNADVTGDNSVAINDLGKVAKAFGKSSGEIGYDVNLDMNKDGLIDIIDIAYVANKVLNKSTSTQSLTSLAMYSVQNLTAAYNTLGNTSISLGVDKALDKLMEGDVVNIQIKAKNPNGLFGTQFTFKYDPAKMQLVDNQVHFNENFSSFGGCTVDTVKGIVKCPVINSGSTTFTTQEVVIGYIPVKITKLGKTTLSLSEIKAVNNQIKEISGNTSDVLDVIIQADTMAPTTPVVKAINDQSTTVTGTTEANADVTVKVGTTVIGSGTADSNGTFSITIPKQVSGTKILVSAKDKAGNESKTEVTVTASYTSVKIQLNGKDFTKGYSKDGTTYVHWKALDTFKIPYSYKGNGVFTIEGRTVQGEYINGGVYIRWSLLSPGKVTYQKITGGYNFIYSIPVKVQLNGKAFTDGLRKDGTTYVHWKALDTFKIPFTYKGSGVYLIEGRSVQGVYVNGTWYIRWSELSPGNVTYKSISGGFNFIYTAPEAAPKVLKIQLNGKNFNNGYFKDSTTYVYWKALEAFQIPYTYKGKGLYIIEGRSVQGVFINGTYYIRWNQLSPKKITYKKIDGGFNFIYNQ